MSETAAEETILKGINASPGICIGKAYLVDKEGVDVVKKYYLKGENIQREINRFNNAVKKAKDEIHTIIENSPEELQQAHILETHLALLNDKLLYGKTIEIIEKEGVNAEWALKKVVFNLNSIFQNMIDSYLKERALDVAHVSDSIMHNLVGVESEDIAAIDKRVILVSDDLSPADTSRINLARIMGFITNRGGKTSHTGIMAQALEIPAVVGLVNATDTIKNEDLIIVDGGTGTVAVTLDVPSRGMLRAGMFASVAVQTDQRDGVVVIPRQALVLDAIERFGETARRYALTSSRAPRQPAGAAGDVRARRPASLPAPVAGNPGHDRHQSLRHLHHEVQPQGQRSTCGFAPNRWTPSLAGRGHGARSSGSHAWS